jgi:hypothetical protein
MGDNENVNSTFFDRRTWTPCPLHDTVTKQIASDLERGEKRMDRFEGKIDQLLEGQSAQALLIKTLQDIVQNGLTSDIRMTRNCTEQLEVKFTQICANYDSKFQEYDEFSWFRKWANRMKNNVISKVLTLTFAGGFLVGVVLLALWMFKHLGFKIGN